jgi:hypothetical protein
MKRMIFVCISLCIFSVACNTAMRDGATTGALKAGMPNTLTLSNGEVVYDLNGKWDMVTQVGNFSTLSGVIDMKQEGNRFVGTLESGNYPGLDTSEKIKGTLKDSEIDVIQFNTVHGWVYSSGGIEDNGKTLTINSQSPSEGFDIASTLKKK